MRAWIKSACVVLACSILPVILAAAVMHGPARPAQANTRTPSSGELTLASPATGAAAPVTTASPAARYVVQPGDTLSAIAAQFAVPGGWPALYAANRPLIGPDPNLIHPGTVLRLPGQRAPARYTVAAGDTLSGIAAAFAVPGGWPALYAANRPLIGPDPNTIHPATILTIPSPATPSPPPRRPARRPPHPTPPPSPPAGQRHHRAPAATTTPATAGLPPWLKILLLAIGLLIAAAFAAEPMLAARTRRHQATTHPVPPRTAQPGHQPAYRQLGAANARIILADHDRLIVTRNNHDNTICVLRRPDEDPTTILRVARLVMPEGPYQQLAEQLGLPASWPMK
jgi:LysM repeat protein